jgi:hypothetical protein
MTRTLTAILVVVLFTASELAGAQSSTQRIRGDVLALDGANLRVKSLEGDDLTVKLTDDAQLVAVSRANAADIKTGSFVGATAAAQPDGTLKASEVHIFPESMRGTGEGHRPMDSLPGSTMTNATVSRVSNARRPSASTMTNATVAKVANASETRKLTLQYKGGEQTVVVGTDTPVVFLEPGDKALLAPGAHVVVIATRQVDSSLAANRVLVGKNGIVPPM